MMDPVAFPDRGLLPVAPPYAVKGAAETSANLVCSIYLEPDELETHVRQWKEEYRRAEAEEVRCECHYTEDADIVLIGYGIVARVWKAVVETGGALGIHVGLLRPITLYPFPRTQVRELAEHTAALAVVELSTGQVVDDVRLAVEGLRPVELYARVGAPTFARLSRRSSTSRHIPRSATRNSSMNSVARIVAEAEAATLERRVQGHHVESARPGETLWQLIDPPLLHGLPERRRRALLDQVAAMEAADYDLRKRRRHAGTAGAGGVAAGSPTIFRGALRTGEPLGPIRRRLEHGHVTIRTADHIRTESEDRMAQ